MAGTAKPYHHGSLRAGVIAAAVAEVQAVGADALSLREIARRAGVSHAAPMHHFGNKEGLFTAIATEGYRLCVAAIGPAVTGRFGFLDGIAAYVRFALDNPGHFEVMFRPGLSRADDPELAAAKQAAFTTLDHSAVRLAAEWGIADPEGLAVAGWSLGHGLATLLLAGDVGGPIPADPEEVNDYVEKGLVALGRVAAGRVERRRAVGE